MHRLDYQIDEDFQYGNLSAITFVKRLKKMGVADILFKRKKELAEKNLNEGNAFLAENAKREGVISLPSGLQYEIIVESAGTHPLEPVHVVLRKFRLRILTELLFLGSRLLFDCAHLKYLMNG